MWIIQSCEVVGGTADTYMSDGQPVVGTRRGPEGASFRLYAVGIGFLDITDTGHHPGGPHYWQLVINGSVYWYDGDGSPAIVIDADGTFRVTGDGNDISGKLLPQPEIAKDDLAVMEEMKAKDLVPYQDPQPGERPYSDVAPLAKQYLQFSAAWYDLGLTLFDWTSADFFRMDVYHLYRYTAVGGQPLDGDDIVNAIWTSNWPPYTPQNVPFMHSLMMTPASSEEQVAEQYEKTHQTMRGYLDALLRLTRAALVSMPRTSVHSKPMLYSGQVAISNLGPDAMAVYFEEYPGNAGPPGQPMGMPIDQALEGFMAPGNVVHLKSFISFTDSLKDAEHYSNGIIIQMSPAPGSAVWREAAYITGLSNEADKIEYTFPPGAAWRIDGWSTRIIDGKTYTVILASEHVG